MTTRKTTRIDLHLHTKGSDGHGSPKRIAEAALEAGLDGVCITDHHKTYTPEGLKVAKACRLKGLLVIHGCEYSTAQGHLLVYGVNIEDLGLDRYPEMQTVIDEVNRRGGVAIPAHPYKGYRRFLQDEVLVLQGVRAFETANGQVATEAGRNNEKAAKAAKDCKKLGVGGSDAHWVDGIGMAYTEFQGRITSEKEFLDALKQGQFRAVVSRKRVESRCRDLTRYLSPSSDWLESWDKDYRDSVSALDSEPVSRQVQGDVRYSSTKPSRRVPKRDKGSRRSGKRR